MTSAWLEFLSDLAFHVDYCVNVEPGHETMIEATAYPSRDEARAAAAAAITEARIFWAMRLTWPGITGSHLLGLVEAH